MLRAGGIRERIAARKGRNAVVTKKKIEGKKKPRRATSSHSIGNDDARLVAAIREKKWKRASEILEQNFPEEDDLAETHTRLKELENRIARLMEEGKYRTVSTLVERLNRAREAEGLPSRASRPTLRKIMSESQLKTLQLANASSDFEVDARVRVAAIVERLNRVFQDAKKAMTDIDGRSRAYVRPSLVDRLVRQNDRAVQDANDVMENNGGSSWFRTASPGKTPITARMPRRCERAIDRIDPDLVRSDLVVALSCLAERWDSSDLSNLLRPVRDDAVDTMRDAANRFGDDKQKKKKKKSGNKSSGANLLSNLLAALRLDGTVTDSRGRGLRRRALSLLVRLHDMEETLGADDSNSTDGELSLVRASLRALGLCVSALSSDRS